MIRNQLKQKKGKVMQQTSANKAFIPPNVSSREFKRDKPPPTDDYREKLFELEKAGELEVQRVPEPYVELRPNTAGQRKFLTR